MSARLKFEDDVVMVKYFWRCSDPFPNIGVSRVQLKFW